MQFSQLTSSFCIESSSTQRVRAVASFAGRCVIRQALCLALASLGVTGCSQHDESSPHGSRAPTESYEDTGAKPEESRKILDWKGYTWVVSDGAMAGNMQADPANVFVKNDEVHLRLVKQPDGSWKGAELRAQGRLGFGTYQWQVDAPLDSFTDAVLGLFNFGRADQIGEEYQNEIDIEFARWGYEQNPNLWWTVWPSVGSTPTHETRSFSLNGGTRSTSRFLWSRTKVSTFFLEGYAPLDSEGSQLVTSWTFQPDQQEAIPQQALPLLMNLWCAQKDENTQCALTQDVEVVIHDFQFVPLNETPDEPVPQPPLVSDPIGDPELNLAREATAYAWSANTESQSNDHRVESAGLNDGDSTSGVMLNDAGEDGKALWEAAGLLWSSPRTISSVAFTNGALDSNGNGYFQSSCRLQFTTDGNSWRDSAWNSSPDYPYSAEAGGQTYTFSGPEFQALGVRVAGETGDESWSASIAELQAKGK